MENSTLIDIVECDTCKFLMHRTSARSRSKTRNGGTDKIYFCVRHAPKWSRVTEWDQYDTKYSTMFPKITTTRDYYLDSVKCDKNGKPV